MGIKSPCKSICTFDVGTGLCKGCWRTMQERQNWMQMTEEEKLATMSAVALRKDIYPSLPVVTAAGKELDNAWSDWVHGDTFGTA